MKFCQNIPGKMINEGVSEINFDNDVKFFPVASLLCSGGYRGLGWAGPPLFWVRKEKMTEGWASKIELRPLLSSNSRSATIM